MNLKIQYLILHTTMQKSHKRHPIAHPYRQDMGCLEWVQSLIQYLRLWKMPHSKHMKVSYGLSGVSSKVQYLM